MELHQLITKLPSQSIELHKTVMDLKDACRIMYSSLELHNRFIGLQNSIDGDPITNFYLHNSDDRTL